MYIHSAVVNLAYEALVLILILSMPPILISLILGLIVAIFQAATQIQEQNLAFTVKLLAVIFTLLLMGGIWVVIYFSMAITSLIILINWYGHDDIGLFRYYLE